MNNIINQDIIPDLTYAKTHLAPFQSIGIGLTIFRSNFIYDDYNFLNNMRKKPTPYRPGD